MGSPTSRSLAVLRENGYRAFIVEKFNSFVKIRIDFGGFGDILAYRPDVPGVLAVNATTNSNKSAHIKKYRENENLLDWLKSGNRFELWCWSKKGARGKRKLWVLDKKVFEISDLM